MRRLAPYGAALGLAGAASAWVLTRPLPLSVGGDNGMLTHPLLVDAFRQLAAGRFPTWSGGRWGGSPLAGDPVVGALYPPYYLGYALTPFPHWQALDVALCLHLALLLVGTAWLLRALETRDAAAVTALVLLALSPTFLLVACMWTQYWAAIAYWPWLLGAVTRLRAAPRVWLVLLAAGALAAQVFAGYPQFALYSGTAGLLWLAVHPGPGRGRWVLLAVLVGTGAIALAAPVLLPGLGLARESIRGGVHRGGAALDRFALSLVAWGDVVRATPIAVLQPAKLAPGTVLLAVAGAATREPRTRFFALLAAVAALLATGPTPLYRLLHAVPPFAYFGGPIKLFYLAALATAVLAAVGLDAVLRAGVRARRVGALALAACALPALMRLPPAWCAVALGTILVTAVPRRTVGTAVIVAAVLGAVAFAAATRPTSALSPFGPGRFAALLHRPPPSGARCLALTADGGTLHQVGLNFGALWGREALNGVGPLAQSRYVEVLERARPEDAPRLAVEVGADPVIVTTGSQLAAELQRAGFRGGPIGLGLSALSPPEAPARRYRLVPGARAVSRREAVEAARRGDALTDTQVLVETGHLDGGGAGDPAGQVLVVDQRPGAVQLVVAVARPTWLVALEPFYPNWRATIDDEPAPVHPAGGLFLAVLVGPGAHAVRLTYREPGLAFGLAVALAGAALLPVLAAVLLRSFVRT